MAHRQLVCCLVDVLQAGKTATLCLVKYGLAIGVEDVGARERRASVGRELCLAFVKRESRVKAQPVTFNSLLSGTNVVLPKAGCPYYLATGF